MGWPLSGTTTSLTHAIAISSAVLQHFYPLEHIAMGLGQGVYLLLLTKNLVFELGVGHF
jgi:hypothetical protein